jgi:hypothetical protein
MRTMTLLAVAALLLVPAGADAQVRGTIIIGGYPVGGVIRIGEPAPRYPRRVVIVEREAPRVIVVEKWKKHRHDRYCRHDRHRTRVIYYDRHDHVYYDRYRPGLVEIDAWEHEGRYYRPDRDR